MADAPSITAPVTTGDDGPPLRMKNRSRGSTAESSRYSKWQKWCRNVIAAQPDHQETLIHWDELGRAGCSPRRNRCEHGVNTTVAARHLIALHCGGWRQLWPEGNQSPEEARTARAGRRIASRRLRGVPEGDRSRPLSPLWTWTGDGAIPLTPVKCLCKAFIGDAEG